MSTTARDENAAAMMFRTRLLRSEVFRIAVLLGTILFVIFFPFSIGKLTLLGSSGDVASLYPGGARPAAGTNRIFKTYDAGAYGWLSEPALAVEHRQLFEEHNFPLWNPDWAFGAPLAADLQVQPYYPLTFALIMHPGPVSFNWYILARLFLAGLFTFLWLRFFVGFVPAATGAISFMLCGYFILNYAMPHLSVEVLLPFVFFSLELLVRRTDWSSAAIVALAVLMVLLGGMPESAILALSFGLAYWIFRSVGMRLHRAQIFRAWMLLASAVLGGVLASMIFILPAAEYLNNSINSHQPQVTGITSGIIADKLDRGIATYLLPLAMGPPWNNIFNGFSGGPRWSGYFGTAVGVLALFALIAAWRPRKPSALDSFTWFFAASATLLLLKRYGIPPVHWAGFLPVFNVIIFPKYGEPLLAFCVAALAAAGVSRALQAENRQRFFAALLAGLALLSAIYFSFARSLVTAVHPEYFYYAMSLGLAAGIALAAVFLLPSKARAAGLLAAVIADLSLNFIVPVFYFASARVPASANPYNAPRFVDFLQSRTSHSRARVYALDDFLKPDWAGAFGLSDARLQDALLPRVYVAFLDTFFPAAVRSGAPAFVRATGEPIEPASFLAGRFLGLSSIEYIVSGHAVPGLREVYSDDPLILQNRSALPRAALFAHVTIVPNGNEALRLLASPAFDAYSNATLVAGSQPESQTLHRLQAAPERPVSAALIRSYSSQRVEIETDARSASLLMLNDEIYPGWRAIVDGSETPILSADYEFRAVALGPGKHRISFVYRPRSFFIGVLLTLAGLIAIGLMFAVGPIRARMQLPAGCKSQA